LQEWKYSPELSKRAASLGRLDVSTSVVSKCVTRMEQSLGVRLLNRTTRSISLTEIGRAFYARCAQIVADGYKGFRLTRGKGEADLAPEPALIEGRAQ